MITSTRRRSSAITTSPQRSGVGLPAHWPQPRFKFDDHAYLSLGNGDRGAIVGMTFLDPYIAQFQGIPGG